MTLWHIRTVVDDEPGRLAALAGSLADLSVNILSVQVHPVVAGAVDDFVADAPPELTEEDLAAAVAAGGGRRATVRPADVHGLADPPTRALQLAARLVRDPESLPLALSDLLDGSAVSWSPAGVPVAEDGFCLRDPRGGHLRVARMDARLTPSEAARARALADLATLLAASGEDVVTWRRAGVGDLDAIADMHTRCSDETRFRRYHSGVSRLTARQLARLVNPRLGVALVGEAPDGRIVALGNLMWCGSDDTTPAELGLLVEDAWQSRGLGTAVTRRLLAAALDAECDQVHALVRPDNVPMLRLLAGLGLPTHRRYEDRTLTVTVDLSGRPAESDAAGRLGRL
ncbi:GNAT family N-acetyltransferase [Cryptosporangium aurantiacum]|uniref:Acetyltransferase (GNAT) domain-containing protein n=1 Tax=Cryptosporangium aurantiacum TaxID=134849 RepID=A0A1M7RNS3_9ACTN|nr:GNAT family N-acetyltransferase [Cryptosporangium aurantiacum]SHN47963.1 Acetyltransferase (GNAT) domain-containing protein [Cryptosporangium aurantiacum]